MRTRAILAPAGIVVLCALALAGCTAEPRPQPEQSVHPAVQAVVEFLPEGPHDANHMAEAPDVLCAFLDAGFSKSDYAKLIQQHGKDSESAAALLTLAMAEECDEYWNE